MSKQKQIYLDYAAATPVAKEVLKDMEPYWSDEFFNPSALYTPAREVRKALDEARQAVSQVLGAKPSEVIFTAGATESINLAILGVANRYKGKNVVISAIEHAAVMAAAETAGSKVCPVSADGTIEIGQLSKTIDDDTVLVSIGYANNEIGTIQPLRDISRLIKDIREDRNKRGVDTPLYLHTDASQAANYLDLHVNSLGVDMMSLNGSKMYGPKQTGCLYVASGVELAPLISGGGQERGLRGGTENVAGFIGFARALQMAAGSRKEESRRVVALRDSLLNQLRQELVDIQVNSRAKHLLPNSLNLTIPGINGETLVHHLDQAGVLVATGAACSANKDQPSHVLAALGLSSKDINSSIRISLGRANSQKDIDRTARLIAKTVSNVKELGNS